MGKDPIKHSATNLANIGNGSQVTNHTLITVLFRTVIGDTTTIKDVANTSTLCNVGDIIKYVNICVEVGARVNEPPATEQAENNGWLEWAVVYTKEQVQVGIPSTNLGVRTVGDIAIKMFRGDCLLTGCIPVGALQPIVQDIVIKIPKNKIKLQIGSEMTFISHLRTVNSTDVRTDSHRLLTSTIYKCYS